MTQYSDNELYELLKAEHAVKEQAFAELYARYSSRVYLYCRKIVSNEVIAEDMFQETFLLFLQHANNGGEVQNVPAYLLRIARNVSLNSKRDTKREVVEFEDFHAPSMDRPLESVELEKLIEAAMETLPPEHREAFVLQMYNGMSYQEIADVTNVPISTVRNRVVRAKKKLRELLASYVETLRS